MAMLMGDLRTALVAADAPADLANRAATEEASYEARLANLETRLSVLTWMAGANLALSMTILFRVFH